MKSQYALAAQLRRKFPRCIVYAATTMQQPVHRMQPPGDESRSFPGVSASRRVEISGQRFVSFPDGWYFSTAPQFGRKKRSSAGQKVNV